MLPSSPAIESEGESPLPALAEAAVYESEREGFEHGLVVLAMGRPFWLIPTDTTYRLLVEPAALATARDQLACFDRERASWPPPPVAATMRERDRDFVTPLLWVLVILAAFHAQGAASGDGEAFAALDARAVFDRGEWWRPVTALFLHADAGHLLANALFGYFAFAAVLASFGRARGWLLLLACAFGANLLAAALHYPEPYRSIGASTAVFAALGLLTGRVTHSALRPGHRHGWRGVFAPAAAGAVLLALYGAGTRNADVIAHVAGFTVGTLGGLIAGRLREPTPRAV